MPAGELSERLRFEYRGAIADDGYGNREGAWIAGTVVAARVRPFAGSESVIAARLQGVQPVEITIRSSHVTRAITPAWRAVDERSGAVYNIRSGANFDERDRYLIFMAEQGEPT